MISGPIWRAHRKIVTPSYNKKSVENFSPIFNKEAEQLARIICQKDPKKSFDVYKDVVKFTTQSVNQTLMGLSKEDSQNLYRMDEMLRVTQDMYSLIFEKMTKWWLHVPLIYWLLGKKKQQDYYVKLIDEFTADIVRRKRKALEVSEPKEQCMGIVDRYILSGELSEKEIQWETMTLFTTDKVYKEMMDVVGPDGPVTSEQLKQLEYLDMVYKETLRYFSIAALIQRTVEEEITVKDGSITLPVGTSLVIPIHNLHRDPRFWKDPHRVMPERSSICHGSHQDYSCVGASVRKAGACRYPRQYKAEHRHLCILCRRIQHKS
ncbi:hypothetical protein HF086_012177 [Spodoptera exigua]|uniref:Cytochrome p450 n=1 Tax=Spodoptera exigua TaxID=7107 RepID=A0A922M7I9_SPOEX|nr:hypothetical protein HF086_012177 [Spodoptera exigua]